MLETQIMGELYDQLPESFDYESLPTTITKYRSNQIIKDITYPSLFISFLEPVMDASNTPINEILEIALTDSPEDIQYTKGIVVRQSIDLTLYDDEIKRIALFQNDLWLWLKQNLSLTDVTVFDILPPKVLDFTEERYIYKRNIEVVCKYAMSWKEIIYTIETIEHKVNV